MLKHDQKEFERLMIALTNIEQRFGEALKEAYLQGCMDCGVIDEKRHEELWIGSKVKAEAAKLNGE